MESQKKILIVDDDSFLLDMYSIKFGQSGFTADIASSADQALEKMKSAKYDVILLDIMMPMKDGFEMLEQANREGLASGTIKIILSNRGQSSDIDRGRELGASGYIVKANATPSEVVAKVNEILAKESH